MNEVNNIQQVNTIENNNNQKNSRKKKLPLILLVVGIVFVIIGVVFGMDSLNGKKKQEKYENAILLFDQKKYSEAKPIFSELDDYELSKAYILVIKAIDHLDKGEYQEAYDTLNYSVPDSIEIVYSIKRFASTGINYLKKDYNQIYEDNKYTTSFYNDKEKEMVYEGKYNYGLEQYNKGYYGSTKKIFTDLQGYKDSDKILNDKYFKIVGNDYMYSVISGYTIGSLSLYFSESEDSVYYNVYVQSAFDTSFPKGSFYTYKIKNNKLIMGNNDITYTIKSFNGSKLVIKSGSSTFTLKKT